MKKVFIEAESICFEKMSGIGHTTLEIIKVLDEMISAKEDMEVSIIVPANREKILRRYKFKNIIIKKFPKGYRYFNYIITRTFIPAPVDLWFGRGVYIFPNYKNWYVPFSKSITFVHDVAFKIYPETVHPKNRSYLEDSFSRWLRRTNKVISISHSSAKELIHYYPKYRDKVNVIYLGVNQKMFFPRTKSEVEQVLKEYGIQEGYFLYVGNMEPRKNILNLIEAYKLYADTNNNKKTAHSLVLVSGTGWNSDKILSRLHELQDEGYLIHVPSKYVLDEDLPAIYTGANALVHVAIHEGFGLSPLQAYACKTKVVSSNIKVLTETLSQYNALFVDPFSVKDIAKALDEIEKHKEPVVNEQKFTWEKTVHSLLALADTI